MIFANLSYSRRQHLGTCLGLALASMILVGSLTIGDSVRATLSYKAKERICLVTHVFLSGHGYFHSDPADRVLKTVGFDSDIKVAPVLMTMGLLPPRMVKLMPLALRFWESIKDSLIFPEIPYHSPT